jgi:hypothetical protein
MLTDERAVFSFHLSVGGVGTGKEACVPNLVIEFEGFEGVGMLAAFDHPIHQTSS